MPLLLPTNTRPPTTVGCANAELSPGNPNAHFSLSLGTSSADNPGFGWKRELVGSTPQPFQSALAFGANFLSGVVHWPAITSAATLPKAFPVIYSAIARSSSSLSPAACVTIAPVETAASTASGESAATSSRFGIRSCDCALSWQVAQRALYNAAPSGGAAIAETALIAGVNTESLIRLGNIVIPFALL